MSHQHRREHHLPPEEEEKLIEQHRKIVAKYNELKEQGRLPDQGTFQGLKGNYRKDWDVQIKEMKARIERYTREHGKKGRDHHR